MAYYTNAHGGLGATEGADGRSVSYITVLLPHSVNLTKSLLALRTPVRRRPEISALEDSFTSSHKAVALESDMMVHTYNTSIWQTEARRSGVRGRGSTEHLVQLQLKRERLFCKGGKKGGKKRKTKGQGRGRKIMV